MARQPRERSSIGFYHVYARGTGGLTYFDDEADHLAQYDLYGRATEKHGWRIHAHCLLYSHHHVLVEVPSHDELVRGMHRLGTAQAMRLNARRDRFGHATAGRFGSTALHAHPDVMRVAVYIATNPVAAGLVDDPSEFRWTSHRATLGAEPAPPWLEVGWLPRLFRDRRLRGVDAYAAAVASRTANLIAARPSA